MLHQIFGALPKFKLLRSVRDDDKVDRLHYVVVAVLLLVMAVSVGTSQLVGDPIHCWVPAEYATEPGQFTAYVNSFCWISSMYHVTMNEPIPVEQTNRQKARIIFYPWVAIMFMVQALLFFLPHLFWKSLNAKCGVNIKLIIEKTMDADLEHTDVKERREILSQTAVYIDRFRDMFSKKFLSLTTKSGSYLVLLFLLTKILYLVNVIVQFPLLSAFLEIDYYTYGIEVVTYLLRNEFWIDSRHFPRISLCDFEIRQLQNVQNWTVQCVLSINLFLEKMYILLWFIFALLAVATVLSLISWTTELIIVSKREKFLEKYRDSMTNMLADDRVLFRKFCRSYLQKDGIFLLRMLERNTSYLISQDVFNLLWVIFLWRSHKLEDWNAGSVSDVTEEFWKKCGKMNLKKNHLKNNTERSVDL